MAVVTGRKLREDGATLWSTMTSSSSRVCTRLPNETVCVGVDVGRWASSRDSKLERAGGVCVRQQRQMDLVTGKGYIYTQ